MGEVETAYLSSNLSGRKEGREEGHVACSQSVAIVQPSSHFDLIWTQNEVRFQQQSCIGEEETNASNDPLSSSVSNSKENSLHLLFSVSLAPWDYAGHELAPSELELEV